MEKYIPVEGKKDVNFIRVHTFYDLGGISWYDYKNKKRGYYVSCTPIFKSEKNGYTTVSTTLFSGYKQLCKEVTRQSKKAEAEAENIAEVLYGDMVNRICLEEGLTVKAEFVGV